MFEGQCVDWDMPGTCGFWDGCAWRVFAHVKWLCCGLTAAMSPAFAAAAAAVVVSSGVAVTCRFRR